MRLRICLLLVLLAVALNYGIARGEAPLMSPPDHAMVPGFDRFFAKIKDDGPRDRDTRGGQLLLGELNCISCHQATAAAGHWLLKKQAPVLDGIGGRVRPSYLKAFLTNPQAAKPG